MAGITVKAEPEQPAPAMPCGGKAPTLEGTLVGEHREPGGEPLARSRSDEERALPPAPPRPHLHLTPVHLDAAGDRTVKTGAGILRRVIVNSAPVGMTGVLTIRDGTQGGGAVLAVITPAAGSPVSLPYDAAFTKGLFLSLAGGVPGDWTVTYE